MTMTTFQGLPTVLFTDDMDDQVDAIRVAQLGRQPIIKQGMRIKKVEDTWGARLSAAGGLVAVGRPDHQLIELYEIDRTRASRGTRHYAAFSSWAVMNELRRGSHNKNFAFEDVHFGKVFSLLDDPDMGTLLYVAYGVNGRLDDYIMVVQLNGGGVWLPAQPQFQVHNAFRKEITSMDVAKEFMVVGYRENIHPVEGVDCTRAKNVWSNSDCAGAKNDCNNDLNYGIRTVCQVTCFCHVEDKGSLFLVYGNAKSGYLYKEATELKQSELEQAAGLSQDSLYGFGGKVAVSDKWIATAVTGHVFVFPREKNFALKGFGKFNQFWMKTQAGDPGFGASIALEGDLLTVSSDVTNTVYVYRNTGGYNWQSDASLDLLPDYMMNEEFAIITNVAETSASTDVLTYGFAGIGVFSIAFAVYRSWTKTQQGSFVEVNMA